MHLTYLYGGFLFVFVLLNYLFIEPVQWQQTYLKTSLLVALMIIILAILFYIFDFIVLNIIRHNQLILDVPFMFRGEVHSTLFIISMGFAGLEELLFRYYVLKIDSYSTTYLLLIGSICFGLVHLKFSKYDIFSKTFLGIGCGVVFLFTNNIIYSILFHCTYNFFALKNKKLEGVAYGNTDKKFG